MNKILIIAVTILIGVVTLLTYQLKRERNEVGRLSANQTALIEDFTYYRTQDSLSVASMHKLSRINSIQAVKTENILAIKTPLKDSYIINYLESITQRHYTITHNQYI